MGTVSISETSNQPIYFCCCQTYIGRVFRCNHLLTTDTMGVLPLTYTRPKHMPKESISEASMVSDSNVHHVRCAAAAEPRILGTEGCRPSSLLHDPPFSPERPRQDHGIDTSPSSSPQLCPLVHLQRQPCAGVLCALPRGVPHSCWFRRCGPPHPQQHGQRLSRSSGHCLGAGR